MSEHILYITYRLNSGDALDDALENENLQLEDEQLDELEDNLPTMLNLKVFFNTEDINGTFDAIDEDLG
jgi:hypothetical protein